ncbi:MAG: hypothetical protein A3F89_01440 [Deltaproteobacteria bacterium RIFCSPLOWO2_12_FULL_50_11]|nr:MAG: hypothetical protein A3B79_00235 [Deltaproteobacteria bacterium RIFCSPHIGHO2_02_FULL_50_15]OGQ67098.1 MAG: hypothetical protein A3F89_01440 [Deltaproteobacteria bacterium RIFCSPLOWO2_12_FULL_50_11]
MPYITCFFLVVLSLVCPHFASSQEKSPPPQFFIEGDGEVVLENSHTQIRKVIRYKDAKGGNLKKIQREIQEIFGLEKPAPADKIHLRLIALLDALQDHFKEEVLLIISGYRSPDYNEHLRTQGKTAAKASLHLEGMAVDVIFPRSPARKVWKYVRSLNCCGVGYYSGKSVHIDIGPTRFWTRKSAKTDLDISAHNKKIFVTTHRDIYYPGEKMIIDFGGVTEYPFGIEIDWEIFPLNDTSETPLSALFRPLSPQEGCLLRHQRGHTKNIAWRIPHDLPPAPDHTYFFRLRFCGKPHESMPDFIDSKTIKVLPSKTKTSRYLREPGYEVLEEDDVVTFIDIPEFAASAFISSP